MAKVIITEHDIMEAKSYIPIVDKDQWVQSVASGCISSVTIAAREGEFNLPMPPFFQDNTMRKSRYLMGAFVSMYLGRTYEPTGDEYLMAADDFDAYAGSHVFNQIERIKTKGGEVRDKAFDMLSDFRDLEKRLNTEVFSLLQIQNDPCTRIMAMIFSQSTPENLKRGQDKLSELKDEIEKQVQGIKPEENSNG